MDERTIKGSVISGYLHYVEKTWGKEGVTQCKQHLNINEIKFKDGHQYPNEMLLNIVRWISKEKGMDYVRKAGNHTVKNLGMLAYVVRFAKMETMVTKAKEAYEESYSYGEVEMEIGDHKAIATMRDVSYIHENCQGWIGALEALLELTHSKGNVLKTKCQLKGDSHCEYEITWK
ncbi:MAG: TIGR02265 family protein [Thermoplasmata archaeon]|nr:TIGR02265 family protein [Thermoplasmata archaeon]MCK5397983.1 TIGR02265 family protein [Thermoplasmata archaeon]